MVEVECCQNPYTKKKCVNQNIKLYLQVEGELLPICSECFNKIIDEDLGVEVINLPTYDRHEGLVT